MVSQAFPHSTYPPASLGQTTQGKSRWRLYLLYLEPEMRETRPSAQIITPNPVPRVSISAPLLQTGKRTPGDLPKVHQPANQRWCDQKRRASKTD